MMAEIGDVSNTEGLFVQALSAPSPEFLLVDEESSSTYPLLTPSPPAEFDHPLALDTPPVLAYERQLSPSSIDTDLSSIPTLSSAAPSADYGALANCLPPPSIIQEDKGKDGMGSSSSSSSVLQDTAASAQLLNPHHYLGLATDVTCQENGGIKPGLCGLTLGAKRNPQDFFFIAWNWPLIRKCCFWGMMSLTVACVCVIIGYITTLPARCDPPRAWYQGSVFYEIFPASFYDSDNDGVGDLKGISAKAHYLESMGVRGVRLNSIFPSEHFPEHYYDIENLTQIEPDLGTLADFRFLVNKLHDMNISIILDIPLGSFFKHQEEINKLYASGAHAHHVIVNNHILNSNLNNTMYSVPDPHSIIAEAIDFWSNHGVDGFYLKDLENFIHEEKFQQHVQEWRSVLRKHQQGFDKIMICSEKVIKALENSELLSSKLTTVLTHFALVDFHIEMSGDIRSQVNAVQEGITYSRPGYPWPMWTLGGVDMSRLASRLPAANATLAAILVSIMLPGTPSIFYGDEIGLDSLQDPVKTDFHDISHVHQLGMMPWEPRKRQTLQWLPVAEHHVTNNSTHWISLTAELRDNSPSIYMHAIWRDGQLVPNCAVKYLDSTLVVLERLYPRRHSYVIIANIGSQIETRDLSRLFYGGHVIFSTGRTTAEKYLTFHKLTLSPGEAMIVKLDK